MASFERQCEILRVRPALLSVLYEHVQRGLPAATIHRLERTGLDKQLILKSLGSPGTLRRKLREGSRLSQVESDRAARLAAIIAQTEELFGDQDKAVHWLTRPFPWTEEEVPPACMAFTSVGTDMVLQRLRQVEHGFCA